MIEEVLIDAAMKVREKAYVPYSEFKVGAALMTDNGDVYTGCNIENASYPATLCAERVAFSKAISEGEKHFAAIAIVGGYDKLIMCPPCGICRQVMSEFCGKDFKVILATSRDVYSEYNLSELLPLAFNLN